MIMNKHVFFFGKALTRLDQRNIRGGDDGGIGNCYQGNTCTFPIAGGQAYGVCGTNSNSQCVCDARASVGQSVVASYCKKP